MKKTFPFKISYIDNLGQGVSKIGDKITLINKTLPGDKGTCVIKHETSKIIFAEVDTFSEKSSDHRKVECPHYESCQGCHYLQTYYDKEIELKNRSHTQLFSSVIAKENINFIKADSRQGYRNRIQLHYDQKRKVVGFKNRKGITPIKNCLMASKLIQEKIAELYKNDIWNILKDEKKIGHIEFYQKDQSVEVTINKGYAAGGFSQVNNEMNQKLIDYLKDQTNHLSSNHFVVDLFGGSGNLSAHLTSPTLVVDHYSSQKSAKSHQSFMSLDIYSKEAVNKLQEACKKQSSIEWLIIDPPRSGLKNITDFTEMMKPNHITYISCNSQTQKRDLTYLLDQYDLLNLTFFDLFPSTFHLESVAYLRRKKSNP